MAKKSSPACVVAWLGPLPMSVTARTADGSPIETLRLHPGKLYALTAEQFAAFEKYHGHAKLQVLPVTELETAGPDSQPYQPATIAPIDPKTAAGVGGRYTPERPSEPASPFARR